jgi:hypothetical protein
LVDLGEVCAVGGTQPDILHLYDSAWDTQEIIAGPKGKFSGYPKQLCMLVKEACEWNTCVAVLKAMRMLSILALQFMVQRSYHLPCLAPRQYCCTWFLPLWPKRWFENLG